MFSSIIKNLSILKKFLFINLIIFLFIGSLTIIYLSYVQPNLIKKKTSIHIQILNNTIQNLNRLNVKFNKEDIKNFLFSRNSGFRCAGTVIQRESTVCHSLCATMLWQMLELMKNVLSSFDTFLHVFHAADARCKQG